MRTVIVTMNEKVDLSVGTALLDLKRVVRRFDPDIILLQEWGRDRDPATKAWCKENGYVYCRAAGGPVLYRETRYTFLWKTGPLLAKAGFVGKLVGRRSNLGASYATRVGLFDLLTSKRLSVYNFHLTAEAQAGGGGYRVDPAHLLRVLRHHTEKRRLGKAARLDAKNGCRTYAGGDTNFHLMKLGGFVNAWTSRSGGSLGWRAVDTVFAKHGPLSVETLSTRSDHDAVCVTYR